MRGGKRDGSGRPKGSPNKRTTERQEVLAQAAAHIPEAFAGDAHALLVTVYKSPDIDLHSRIDAAKAAIPYEKPRLSTIAHTGQDGGAIKVEDVSLTETARRVAFMLAKAAHDTPSKET